MICRQRSPPNFLCLEQSANSKSISRRQNKKILHKMVFWTNFYLNSSQKENELIFSIESKEVPTRLKIGDIKRLKSHVEKLEKAHLARVTLQGSSYSY